MRFLAKYTEPAYAALRAVSGFLFLFHGANKVLGLFAKSQPRPFSQIWAGGVIELVCGVLVAIGLFTRPAAFLASGTMAVAYFQFHFKFDVSGFRWLPYVNQGEHAALFCFVFFYIAARGPGLASLDARLRRA
ncbi:MAG TPA: DoxX family protein [Polyangiaceae bacterium]|nr:DoxX family protein [Polyangiaceae bacterium]